MVSMRSLAFLSTFRCSLVSKRAIATLSSSFLLSRASCNDLSHCQSSRSMSSVDTGYLDAESAANLDKELMSTPGFTLEQLMELAGLSVAEAVYTVMEESTSSKPLKILVICGPGNNGGDGLVAARHLVLFGYECTVVYPKRSSRQPHYQNLVVQCEDMGIPVLDSMPSDFLDTYEGVIDAIFGFSFKGEPREPFATIITQMKEAQAKSIVTFAVDVPSGWNVDEGDVSDLGFVPDVLVSLTAPKLSAKDFPNRHFVGGRFLPLALAEKYNVRMPPYPRVAQVMEVTRTASAEEGWEKGYAEYLAEKEAKEFATYAKEKPSEESWETQYAAYLAEKATKEES